jgi:hypothetical protein
LKILFGRDLMREASMGDRNSYDQDLRVIGQALEAKRIHVFELKNHGDRYVVRGDPEKEASLLAQLRDWAARTRGHSLASSGTYWPADLDLLERQGRLNRRVPNRLPDFYSLSNTLRTVGSYLDLKGAELLELHKRPLSLMLLYHNKHGHPDVEERTIVSFYNLFIDLYGKRRRGN